MIEFTAWEVYAYENTIHGNNTSSEDISTSTKHSESQQEVVGNNRLDRIVVAEHLPQVSEKGFTFKSFHVEADKGVFAGRHDGAVLHWPLSPTPSVTTPHANTLRGHTGAVLSLDFATDLGPQGLLVSGSADRSIRLWDPWGNSDSSLPTRSGYTCVQTLSEHSGSVVCVRVMPQQNNGLVSCSLDHTVRTWYPAEGRALLLYPWYIPAQSISQPGSSWPSAFCVRSGANGTLFVGDSSGYISVYTHASESSSSVMSDGVNDKQLDSDIDAKFRFRLRRKFEHFHSLGISRLAMVADNCFVVSLGYDEKAQVIDAISGALSSTICSSSAARFMSCAWDAHGNTLLLGDATGFVHLWNIFEDKLVGKTQIVSSMPLTIIGLEILTGPTGDFLLTGLPNGVKQWLCNRNMGYVDCSGHSDTIIAVAIIDSNANQGDDQENPRDPTDSSTESYQFVSASLDGSIRCWDSYDMKVNYSFEERHSEITCMIASKRFQRIFTGHDDGSIKVWSLHSGEIQKVSFEGRSSVTCITSGIVRDQEVLLAGSSDGLVSMWEVTNEGLTPANPFNPVLPRDRTEDVTCLVFSNGEFLPSKDQEFFVAGYFTGQITIWSFAKKATLCTFKATDAVCSLALHGCILFSGSEDSLLRMWNMFNINQTYELGVLRPPTSFSSSPSGSPIVCLELVPVSGLVLSAAADGTIIAWDYKTFDDETALDAFGKIMFRANIEGRMKCLKCWPERRAMICGNTEGKLLVFDLPQEFFTSR